MPKVEIQKRTLQRGWTELRIVLNRPDTPDFKYEGDEALMHIAHFVLSFAAGMAHSLGAHGFEYSCRAFYDEVLRHHQQRSKSTTH